MRGGTIFDWEDSLGNSMDIGHRDQVAPWQLSAQESISDASDVASDDWFDPIMNPPVDEVAEVIVWRSRNNYWYWEPEYWG